MNLEKTSFQNIPVKKFDVQIKYPFPIIYPHEEIFIVLVNESNVKYYEKISRLVDTRGFL